MTTPSDDDLNQWAFRMQPQFTQTDTGWTGSYPGADWSVSAPTHDAAQQKLKDEVLRRRDAGDDPFGYAGAVYRQHLREPVPGVYAMDNELYRQIARETGYDQSRLQQVFEEAERRRAAGQSYTRADYDAEQSG